MNRLHRLRDAGQSIWMDFIERAILRDGELERRTRDDAITGMTSNPTIFEKALAEGTDYDEQLRNADRQLTAQELFEVYVIREALETAALRHSVELATPRDHDLARAAQANLERAIVAGDARALQRGSRRFHFALIAPCRMHRLLRMLGIAWNMTEPLQPVAYLPEAQRAALHADHAEMLAAFVARDAQALIRTCTAHHHRLRSSITLLPTDVGLLAEPT